MRDFYRDCCQKNPFWKEPGSGKILCRKCFTSIIENRVRRTINRMQVIRYKSKIGIALSGGKDSTVLLHILSNLYRKRPDISLIALIIDEGIVNYRDESLLLANKNCQILQVPNVIESFKSLYGMTLDEIIHKRNKQKIQTSSCAICGVLRRRALNLLGKREKVDIITTGHTLDDQVQTIFLNLLRGDSQRILRETRRLSENQEIRRIKPLSEISEVESTLYAYVKGFSIQTIRCPYSSEAMRNKIRQFLIDMEHHHPTTMISTLRAYSRIKDTLKTAKITEGYTNNTCTRCNVLTSRKLCQTCKIIEDLSLYQS